jgi:dGTPase
MRERGDSLPMTIREQTEQIEREVLHPRAARAAESRGRRVHEPEGEIRTCYQRDRDRIIHCKSFRRLKHKTQVFLAPVGDHYRTRLTHVLEVSQIARTIARALRLNEDLTEAIALGHDLGHTPFGHAGEEFLREIHPGGFKHYEQSLRVVDVLERGGRGLNLTEEVRDGILKHSKGKGLIVPSPADRALTLEGQVVRVSDSIAYLNHDLDDAMRAGVISEADLPASAAKVLGTTYSGRIDRMVKDFIHTSLDSGFEEMRMGSEVHAVVEELRAFMYDRVYEGEVTKGEFKKAKKILQDLYTHFLEHPAEIRPELPAGAAPDPQAICDFIAGMTDRYAILTYKKIFLPEQWPVY